METAGKLSQQASAPTHALCGWIFLLRAAAPRALKIEFNKLKKYSTTYKDTHTAKPNENHEFGGMLGNSLLPFSHFKFTHITHLTSPPFILPQLAFRCIHPRLEIRNPRDGCEVIPREQISTQFFLASVPYVIVLWQSTSSYLVPSPLSCDLSQFFNIMNQGCRQRDCFFIGL